MRNRRFLLKVPNVSSTLRVGVHPTKGIQSIFLKKDGRWEPVKDKDHLLSLRERILSNAMYIRGGIRFPQDGNYTPEELHQALASASGVKVKPLGGG